MLRILSTGAILTPSLGILSSGAILNEPPAPPVVVPFYTVSPVIDAGPSMGNDLDAVFALEQMGEWSPYDTLNQLWNAGNTVFNYAGEPLANDYSYHHTYVYYYETATNTAGSLSAASNLYFLDLSPRFRNESAIFAIPSGITTGEPIAVPAFEWFNYPYDFQYTWMINGDYYGTGDYVPLPPDIADGDIITCHLAVTNAVATVYFDSNPCVYTAS